MWLLEGLDRGGLVRSYAAYFNVGDDKILAVDWAAGKAAHHG